MAIYCRISRDSEGQELGVQRQEQYCRDLADRLGWTVAGVYVDNDISASSRSKKGRPKYEAMLAAAEDGTIGGIVAYSTSRLTRRPLEFERLIEVAEKGVAIATVAAGEVDLRTANGRAIARTLAAFDAREAEENSERSLAERQQRRERGLWHGGNRPFGFEKDGTTPRPAEQRLIRSGAEAILNGATVASVAREWSKATLTPAGRTTWRPSSVRDVLLNPRVAGLLPNESPAVWKRVIDEGSWQAVVALLTDPSRRRDRGESRLLTGIAFCGRCGDETTVNGGITKAGDPTYRCPRRNLDRAGEPVDMFVAEIALQYVAREQVSPAKPGDDRTALAVEARALRGRKDALADDLGIDERILARRIRAIDKRLVEIDAAMAAAASTSMLGGLPLGLPALREWWESATVEQHRSLLTTIPIVITLHPPGKGKRPPRGDRHEILRWAARNVEISWRGLEQPEQLPDAQPEIDDGPGIETET